MPRNSSGVYSLPAGNPVITGTIISSTWANSTSSDIGVELTNSLDRNGRGGMLAALRLIDGSAASPALAFTSDPTTGLFRVAANVIGITTGAIERMRLDSSGNLGIGTTSPQSRLHTVGTLTVSSGGDITTVDQALGIINFRSDDVSVSSSGTFASIAARNEFPGGWDGTLSRIDTYLAFSTASDATMAERMRLDSSGNLGLGVTPSAWGGQRAIDFAYGGLSSGSVLGTQLVANAVYNGTNWLYRITSAAYRYEQDSAGHKWYIAPSGTAGNAIAFTQAMTLDASGNLGLGVTPSPGSRLHVSSSASEIARFQTSGADMYLRFVNSVDPNGYIGYQNRALTFWTANVQCMSLDASGNLGLGVTPSAWGPAYKAMQLFFGGGPFTSNTGAVGFTGNCFHNGSNWVYASSNPATRYELGPDSGNHRWFTAPPGTAGNAITFTQAMTLTSAGLLQLAAGNTGGGVALNNAANTSPTVLDWYEEGTFTPTLTGIGSPTYTTQSGSYTRIGNVVHFNITLNWTGGTNGAAITVASLPFTAAGVNTPVSISVNYLGNASFTWTGAVKAYVSGGTTNISPVVESSGASNAALLNPSAGTKDMIISGTYRVL
jgi:hypothetical protein